MRLSDYPKLDGKQVWLSQDEFQQLLDAAETNTHRLAFLLGGRTGLRRDEIASVQFNDFRHADDGFVRVWGDYAKRDKYREAPVPDRVRYSVEALEEQNNGTDPVIDVTGRTINRWVQRAADTLEEQTGDEGWSYVRTHDLRRTWAAWLIYERGVVPAVVFNWGGWSDWQTFRDHYLGTLSPEAARRERDRAYGSGDVDERVTSLYSGSGTNSGHARS